MELWLFFLRWVHFLAGITWIGILYYFNFIQTPFFAETDAPVRSAAVQKLVPRALWWFRWGAMFTFLSGILIYMHKLAEAGGEVFYASPYGLAITTGGVMGTLMFLNVWVVIWPKQQVVIASATQAAQGGAGNSGGSCVRTSGEPRVQDQYPFLYPDALFHGIGEPLSFDCRAD